MVKSKDYEIITIHSRLYDLCVKSSYNQWANKKKGNYGKGIINSKDDERKCERTGKLGEAAFGFRYKMGEPDWSYREYGDDGFDFSIFGYSIDVKMSKYIMVERNGKWIGLKSDVYIIGEIETEYRKQKTANVCLHGFITKNEINSLVNRDIIRWEYGVKDSWKNYQIKREYLTPLNIFEKWINKNRKKQDIIEVDNSDTQLNPQNIFF